MSIPGEGPAPDGSAYMWGESHDKALTEDPFAAQGVPLEYSVQAHLAIISLRQTQSLRHHYCGIAAELKDSQPSATQYLDQIEDVRELKRQIRGSHQTLRSADRLATSRLYNKKAATAHDVTLARVEVSSPNVARAVTSLVFHEQLFRGHHPYVITESLLEDLSIAEAAALQQRIQDILGTSQRINEALAMDPFRLARDMAVNRGEYFAPEEPDAKPTRIPATPLLTSHFRQAFMSVAVGLHQTLLNDVDLGYSIVFPELIGVHASLQEHVSRAAAGLVFAPNE